MFPLQRKNTETCDNRSRCARDKRLEQFERGSNAVPANARFFGCGTSDFEESDDDTTKDEEKKESGVSPAEVMAAPLMQMIMKADSLLPPDRHFTPLYRCMNSLTDWIVTQKIDEEIMYKLTIGAQIVRKILKTKTTPETLPKIGTKQLAEMISEDSCCMMFTTVDITGEIEKKFILVYLRNPVQEEPQPGSSVGTGVMYTASTCATTLKAPAIVPLPKDSNYCLESDVLDRLSERKRINTSDGKISQTICYKRAKGTSRCAVKDAYGDFPIKLECYNLTKIRGKKQKDFWRDAE